MSRASITKAHQKIQELSWEPTFVEPVDKYPTDYTFEKAPKKDPLKQVLRSYFPMEEEKDNRVFGAMDGAIRGNMFRQVQQRWMEWQKLFLSIIPFPEISAARAMPLAINAVPNPEVHNGLAIQMIDEVRHSTIQMNLKRLYMNHYIDPAGFDLTEKGFANCYAGTIGRQFGEGFITGDAITAANVYLTIVAETAFTNVLFVAMPGEAAANGDYLLPTVFHSVQSDESRHISNGYSIILMALADERNRQLLERDLRYAWWNNHAVVDAAIGTFIEYGTKDRRKDRESYAEAWRRWIYDDYYRSYLVPLEKYGLTIPHDLVEESWNRIINKGYIHEVAQFFATGWFANYWRIDPMDDEDFEWFEFKYPGWYDKYGKWWEKYAELSKKNGHKPIAFEAEANYQYPHRCWTCMVPCLIREDTVMDEVDGQVRTYCSETCHWTDKVAFRPEYEGRPTPSMGKLSRSARVGDPASRQGPRRDHADPRVHPRRRQHARPAAAPEPRPQGDVDPGPTAAGSRSTAPTCSSTRCRPRSARRTWPTTSAGGPPAARRRPRSQPATGSRQHGRLPSNRHGEHAHRSFRARRHRDRGRRGRDHPQRSLPAGLMLMHGCKEGQCSACKSFLLDGEVDLDRYSTFALPDFEEAEGWTLLCRAHPYSDLEIELINYDEEVIHSGTPIRTVSTRVEAVEELTSDIRLLRLRPDEPFEFKPGQYVDIKIPGGEGHHRSFSMANLPGDGVLEFMIKLYPGGRFSGLLEDGSIKPGDELEVTGPYGVFTLRASSPRRLLFIGGGAGMAPILSLLRSHSGGTRRRRITTAREPSPTCSTSRSSARCRAPSCPRCRRRATAGAARPG